MVYAPQVRDNRHHVSRVTSAAGVVRAGQFVHFVFGYDVEDRLRSRNDRPKVAYILRPFLMQSDSASRKRPFSTGHFFDWILLVLLLVVRSSVESIL